MSAFTHLARSVLGARYRTEEVLFAMMTCYFDESIEKWTDDEGKSRKFTFVCGYVASVQQWERFEVDWRRYLDLYEITDFHMADYCQNAGEFRKWRGEEFASTRTNFIQDASIIIRKFARYGFVAAVSDSVFQYINEMFKLKESCGSPYGLVGRECADLARTRRSRFYPKESDLEYVYEDGGPDKRGLVHAMTELRPAFPYPIFKPGKTHKPSRKYPDGRKAVVQLQAADYLAYEVRKLFADQIKVKPIRGVRLSFEALTPIPTAKQMFTDKELIAMCKRNRIDRRK